MQVGDGYELRGEGAVLGRVGPSGSREARAQAAGTVWRLGVEGDRDVAGATWEIVARDDHGETAARYFHGSMRGGRIRGPGDSVGSLRRQLGVVAQWRFRLPDAAFALRPAAVAPDFVLELAFVPGSAEVPSLLLLLVCWCVVNEETIAPMGASG